jgi:hypothetical protein
MKKPLNKRSAQTMSLQLGREEPWDTMKAQLLVKITAAFKPATLNFDSYDILFYIPRILPKPGSPLMCDDDYSFLLKRSQKCGPKDSTIYISITERAAEGGLEKENHSDEETVVREKKAKKVRVFSPCLHMLTRILAYKRSYVLPCECWQKQEYPRLARGMEVPEAAAQLPRRTLLHRC